MTQEQLRLREALLTEPSILFPPQLLCYGQAFRLFAKSLLQRFLGYLLIACFCLPEKHSAFLQK